ncbi:PDZ and LIM domain protein 5a [Chanos chanos]|uniref:PDZ and LIM domain protein 5a n=1 Tax=Chanos chanos TaxID=29144 RepID=A0A6J2WTK3_CHACN|nr:PDZ and LIM domain protein 5-like [Chanos chanos]
MSDTYSVTLAAPAPWGFRLQGGKDFNLPLTISRLTDGGKAAQANVSVGDVVLSIDGIRTDGMTHLEAQNKIKACSANLSLTLQRASSVVKPAVPDKADPVDTIKPVALISHSHPPPEPASSSITSTHCAASQPCGCGGGGGAGGTSIPSASSAFSPASFTQNPPSKFSASIPGYDPTPTGRLTAGPPSPVPAVPQPSVYNTPIRLYSNENACEVAMGQRRGLLDSQGNGIQLNGVPRKPIVETDIGFYHVPSHGDASRKRIMEDTEDWRPRTGTSQSRSFRILAQITGTESAPCPLRLSVSDSQSCHALAKVTITTLLRDRLRLGGVFSPSHLNPLLIAPPFLQPPEKNQRSSLSSHTQTRGKSEEEEEAGEEEPSAHVTGPVKTMVKGSSSPSTGGALSGLGTPKFGVGGVNSPAGPTPARPVPQAHPKDEDTVVQKAEHIPAGTRTPVCAHCNTVIRGPFLVAMGKSWHPEEFTCAHCHTSLAHVGFVEEQGSGRGTVYCEHCYEEFFAPTCARCQGKILGEVINALKQTWHVCCFLCASCQQPIRNKTFHLEDGQPYCQTDYYSLFGTGCHGCDFPIEAGDKFLEALGYTWHDTCFVCTVCSTSLEGQTFFVKKDKPLCKKHAYTLKV